MSDLLVNATNRVHIRTWYMMHFLSSRVSRICQLSEMDRESRECNHLWVLIRKCDSGIKWNWKEISANPLSTWDDLISRQDKYSAYSGICANPNISYHFLITGSFPDGSPIAINWEKILCRSDVPLCELQEYIDSSIDAKHDGLQYEPITQLTHARIGYAISENPNLTFKFITDNIQFSWEWEILSWNPAIRVQDIIANLSMKWNWHLVSLRKFDVQLIANCTNVPWDWETLSQSYHIDPEFVDRNRNLPWVAQSLARNEVMKNYINNWKQTGFIPAHIDSQPIHTKFTHVLANVKSWRDAIHLLHKYPTAISSHTFYCY